MFGYVKPYVPNLRVREHEAYRALYCGLCRSMGRHTGVISRLTLSYDFVFLAAVRSVLDDSKLCPFAHWCALHPFEKRACYRDNPSLSYSAAASAFLIKAKAEDDIKDSKGIKKLAFLLTYPFVKSMSKKAGKLVSIPEKEIRQSLTELDKLEKSDSPSIDDAADTFGSLLKTVFSYGLTGPNKLIAEAIGMSVGRYIYVIDVVDDAEKDKKTGNYNPVNVSNINKSDLLIPIKLELQNLSRAVELIDFGEKTEIEEIIKNVTYEGLPKIAESVFAGTYMKGKKSE